MEECALCAASILAPSSPSRRTLVICVGTLQPAPFAATIAVEHGLQSLSAQDALEQEHGSADFG